jgi:hypothetical protein
MPMNLRENGFQMRPNQGRDREISRRETEMRSELIVSEMASAVRVLGGNGPALEQINRALRADNSSGAPGVYRHSRTGRWYAQCCHGGKNRHLGFFGSFEEAARARRKFQMDHGYHENHGRPALAARIAAKKEAREMR